MIDYIYYENYKYPITAVVSLTEECNLACRYCFVEKHPHYISLDTVKDIVSYLINNLEYQRNHPLEKNNYLPNDGKANICFFGGEPCLMYDSIIQPIIIYCKQKYPNQIHFSMTTNGTLLNEERIKFLAENNVELLFSIDGNPTMQNYNRPYKNSTINSSDILESIIPIILKYYPNITGRMTAYAPTIQELYNSYIYLENKGFKSITIIPDIRHEWNNDQIQEFENQYTLIFKHRLEQYLLNEPVCSCGIFEYWEEEIIKYLQQLENPTILKKPLTPLRCGIGIKSCSIGWDGNIYGCQEQISGYNHNEEQLFKIGNIYENGIDVEKHKKLINFYMATDIPEAENKQEMECENCILKDICSPRLTCFSSLYDINHSAYKYPTILCKYNQILFKNLLLKIVILAETKNLKEV